MAADDGELSDALRRSMKTRYAWGKFIFANSANDCKILSQSIENFRILRRCEGIASDETVTKLLLTLGSLETHKNFLGSAQKNRVGRVTLNKVFFFFCLIILL